MTVEDRPAPRPPDGMAGAAARLLRLQAGLTAALFLIGWPLLDLRVGVSLALGGGVAVAGTLAFAWQVARLPDTADAWQVTRVYYRAEFWKFLLMAVAFAAILVTWDVSVPALFGGYLVAATLHALLLMRD